MIRRKETRWPRARLASFVCGETRRHRAQLASLVCEEVSVRAVWNCTRLPPLAKFYSLGSRGVGPTLRCGDTRHPRARLAFLVRGDVRYPDSLELYLPSFISIMYLCLGWKTRTLSLHCFLRVGHNCANQSLPAYISLCLLFFVTLLLSVLLMLVPFAPIFGRSIDLAHSLSGRGQEADLPI